MPRVRCLESACIRRQPRADTLIGRTHTFLYRSWTAGVWEHVQNRRPCAARQGSAPPMSVSFLLVVLTRPASDHYERIRCGGQAQPKTYSSASTAPKAPWAFPACRLKYTSPPDSENSMISAAPTNETSSADSRGSPSRLK